MRYTAKNSESIHVAILLAFVLAGMLLVIGMAGCGGGGGADRNKDQEVPAGCTDDDGDGFYAEEECGKNVDCNDADHTVNPRIDERCVDLDMDCDGLMNEGCAPEVCGDEVDNDGDGVIDEACGPGTSFISDAGQTRCYDADELLYPCPSPGEAFYGQDACYAFDSSPYTKLDGNGTALPDDALSWAMVRDNVTGLIWEVKTDDDGLHDKDLIFAWADATDVFMAELNNLDFGGYSDWRLPTIIELNSIMSFISCVPAIDLNYFPNTMRDYYWSSTFAVNNVNAEIAWVADFFDGGNLSQKRELGCYVRAVRGQPLSPVYTDNGDGTITATDNGRSLMWAKASAPEHMTWQEALAYCDNLTLAGYSDWRLPSIKELRTAVDYSRILPASNPDFFPDTSSLGYWSSTTSASYGGEAWCVDFSGGASASNNDKTYVYQKAYVRAVRGGR